MKTLIASLAALGLVGCSVGFNRLEMQQKLEEDERIFVDDPDVLRVEQLQPQLRMPFRLAVVPPSMIHRQAYGQPGETEGERKEILAWGDRLRQEGIISELILIPEMLVSGVGNGGSPGGFKAIRVAAARLGADAILVLRSVSSVDRYVNPLVVLDVTLVGMFLFPAHHQDTLTIVEGLLIDNRNQYIYLAASSEGKGSTLAPLALLDHNETLHDSRIAALKSFGDTLVQQGRRIQGSGR